MTDAACGLILSMGLCGKVPGEVRQSPLLTAGVAVFLLSGLLFLIGLATLLLSKVGR